MNGRRAEELVGSVISAGKIDNDPERRRSKGTRKRRKKKTRRKGEGPSLGKKTIFNNFFLYKNIIPKIHNHTNNLYTFN